MYLHANRLTDRRLGIRRNFCRRRDFVACADYSVFGAVRAASGEYIACGFVGMLGVERDPTGLLFMRNRYYSPALGRFLTRDPIGIAGGDVNWYCYCGNDPVNFVDDDGLMSWSEWCKKWLMGLLGMLYPHPAPSGMSYAADPFGHGKIPGTENLKDPHIHQIPKRHGPHRKFDKVGRPLDGGPRIPERDWGTFLKAVRDLEKYIPKGLLLPIMVMPPGIWEQEFFRTDDGRLSA